MTGREAVQFFASCNHNGKIKSLYFNQSPSRHFAPYDLISVPKAKVSKVKMFIECHQSIVNAAVSEALHS